MLNDFDNIQEELDQLPPQTLDEIRDDVRCGKDLQIEKDVVACIEKDDPNGLSKMRRLSHTLFLILENRNRIARLQESSPSPLADICEQILTEYAEQSGSLRTLSAHIYEKSREKQKKFNALTYHFLLDILENNTRVIAMKVEYEILLVHAQLKEWFFNNYIQDRYPDDEWYTKIQKAVRDFINEKRKELHDTANSLGISLT